MRMTTRMEPHPFEVGRLRRSQYSRHNHYCWWWWWRRCCCCCLAPPSRLHPPHLRFQERNAALRLLLHSLAFSADVPTAHCQWCLSRPRHDQRWESGKSRTQPTACRTATRLSKRLSALSSFCWAPVLFPVLFPFPFPSPSPFPPHVLNDE